MGVEVIRFDWQRPGNINEQPQTDSGIRKSFFGAEKYTKPARRAQTKRHKLKSVRLNRQNWVFFVVVFL